MGHRGLSTRFFYEDVFSFSGVFKEDRRDQAI